MSRSGIPSTWKRITTISAHAGGALDAIADPTARFIVSAGDDGVARLWDRASGRAVGTSLAVRQGVLSEARVAVSLADDGRSVVVVNDRGEGAIWPLDEAVWAEHACSVAGRTLTEQELETYLPGQDAPKGCTD